MQDILTDAVVAVVANPAACELEVVTSELGVVGTANALEAAVKRIGGRVIKRFSDEPATASFIPPNREYIVFRGRPESGFARRRDQFVLVPAVCATIDMQEDGVWITFAPADRGVGDELDRAA